MVLPLLLIKEGVSDLLNGMTVAYKTGDYQLTVSKTSVGPFNRALLEVIWRRGHPSYPGTLSDLFRL